MDCLPATSRPTPERIDDLVARVNQCAEAYKAGQGGSSEALMAATTCLQRAIEQPAQYVQRLRFQPLHHAALSMALDAGIIDAINSLPGHISSDEIARCTKHDRNLIVRLMRVLTALGVGEEVRQDVYGPNDVSRALALPGNRGGLQYFNEVLLPVCRAMPQYLRDLRMQRLGPAGCEEGPLSYTFGMSFWSLLKKDAQLKTAFDNSMVSNNGICTVQWFEKYPAADVLLRRRYSSSSAGVGTFQTLDEVAIVDVAGGYGHDLRKFCNVHPHVPGRMVVQDLPETLDSVTCRLAATTRRIEYSPHDIFTPQPIKGAQIYYLHNICHDWSDAQCKIILSHLAQAMRPGISRLLIDEIVLADSGETLKNAELDLLMMLVFEGQERTLQHWQTLLGGVSPPLRIVGVYRSPDDFQAVLEIKLEEDLNEEEERV